MIIVTINSGEIIVDKINSQNILEGKIDVDLLNYKSHKILTAKLNT